MLVLGFVNNMVRCDYTIPIVVIGMIAYWMNDFPRTFYNLNGTVDKKTKQGPFDGSGVSKITGYPNYFQFQWPAYYKVLGLDGKEYPLALGFPYQDQIFYLRHCISAAELFLLSLIFSIILDVLWISVHGDYLRDYGTLPLMVESNFAWHNSNSAWHNHDSNAQWHDGNVAAQRNIATSHGWNSNHAAHDNWFFRIDFSIKSLVTLHRIVLGFSILQLLMKLFSIYWIVLYIRVLCNILWFKIPAEGTQEAVYEEPAPPPAAIAAPNPPQEPKEKRENIEKPSTQDL